MKDHFLNDMLDDSKSSADKSVKKRLRHEVKQKLKVRQDTVEDDSKKKNGWDTRYRGGHKIFKKWLKKQVGRPWNDVYSEISQALKGKPHIKKDLLWCIDMHVKMIDGKPHVWGWRMHGKDWYPLTSSENYTSFYVHPKDGLLKVAPRKV